MCEASNLSAEIDFEKVPIMDKIVINYYLEQGCIPGGTHRNWDSYGHKIGAITEYQKHILADPQTSGGLLVAVESGHETEFIDFCKSHDLDLQPFGKMIAKQEKMVLVV
jgi:selenide,water dikinase